MQSKLITCLVVICLTVGGFVTSASASPDLKQAAHELQKFWSAWNEEPEKYQPLVEVLVAYRWPTADSTHLAHKLAYEINTYENDGFKTYNWQVTDLLLRAALGDKALPSQP